MSLFGCYPKLASCGKMDFALTPGFKGLVKSQTNHAL